ncbi:MAG: 50S ribosomal protein L9 [Anaerolineales bacterium]|nr:50S ribosomal protein L9 [Anaerolineales bacterium]
MRVLLLKDVYKLGRAGDIKKVADGFGRNFLVPQGLAMMATPGAIKQADRIRRVASVERTRLNQELGAVAERLNGLQVVFATKAGETGKLYGSITHQMIAEAIEKATGVQVERRQIDCQPVKTLGVHKARIRLTVDLIPEVQVVVHREGEPPESAFEQRPVVVAVVEAADDLVDDEAGQDELAVSEIESEPED